MKFTSQFNDYACPGDSIVVEHKGFTFTARLDHDPFYHIDDDDCHNPDPSVTGATDEQHAKIMQAREAWMKGEWYFGEIVISVSKGGVKLADRAASVCGVWVNYLDEGNSYFTELANELLPEAFSEAEIALASTIKALTS